MPNQDLITWVNQVREKGYSIDQIKQYLSKAGYNNSDIEQLLNPKSMIGPNKKPNSNMFAIICFITSFFMPPISIIFGILAINKIITNNFGGKGFVNAGLLISTLPYILITTGALILFGIMDFSTLIITFLAPLTVVIFGIFNINRTIKNKDKPLWWIVVICILFILILPFSLGSLLFFGTF